MSDKPRVGVGVFVLKDGKVLFQKRKNAHGDGTWCLPGGHLEFNETVENCAKREVLEESGLEIKNIKLATFTQDIFKSEGKHYITLYAVSDHDSGSPKIMEPDKCDVIGWFDWNNLPTPLFLPIVNLIDSGWSPFQKI